MTTRKSPKFRIGDYVHQVGKDPIGTVVGYGSYYAGTTVKVTFGAEPEEVECQLLTRAHVQAPCVRCTADQWSAHDVWPS